MTDLIIGSHVSFQGKEQLLGSVKEALSYNSKAFMIYTGAPQNTRRTLIDDEKTRAAYREMKGRINLQNVVVHAPYIINLASTGSKHEFAVRFLKEEINRVASLGITLLVLHPGNYVDLPKEEGIKNIINALNNIIEDEKVNQSVLILLETMSGKGTEIGANFNELAEIINGVKKKERIKVCLDTCHMHDAGYDVSNFTLLLEEFMKIVGDNKIACVHINDSLNERGLKKDRHANIGFGKIGFDNLREIIYHPKLKDVPKILETPFVTLNDETTKKIYPPYKFEIEMIKNKTFNPNLFNDIRDYYK